MVIRTVYVCIGVLVLMALYLLLWPVPIEPIAWTPMTNPGFIGPYEKNNKLSQAKLYCLADGHGPEDTAIGPDGLIYTGLSDGSIVRFSPENAQSIETITNTGGRPLGMQFRGDRLYIADAFVGLIYIDNATAGRGHQIEIATDALNGERLLFVDDLDIASDGTVWFSDASTRFDLGNTVFDYLEQRPTGRLLSWDPATGDTKLHVEELAFANGVALGPDGAYVLVNETMRYRITRYWLTGAKAGQTDVFVDNLPGFPDNLSHNHKGLFWVALIYQRDVLLDNLMPKPFLRKLIVRLPRLLRVSEPDAMAWVIALDYDGTVVHNLQDHTGHYYNVTSVKEGEGYLWLGSLTGANVARVSVPQ